MISLDELRIATASRLRHISFAQLGRDAGLLYFGSMQNKNHLQRSRSFFWWRMDTGVVLGCCRCDGHGFGGSYIIDSNEEMCKEDDVG
jgi:hypothetical protein